MRERTRDRREVDPMAKFSKAPKFDTSFNFGANVKPKRGGKPGRGKGGRKPKGGGS
jgi:hypothetical protein